MAPSPGRQVFDHEPEPCNMSEPMQDGQQHMNEEHAQDGKYLEVKSTTSVPTKHEDETEMQTDSDRPGSAGTTHSMPIPQEEEELLASLAAPNTQQTDPITSQSSNNLFFSRPETPTEVDAHVTFSYGKASKQQMDFQGTRKLPQSAAMTRQPEHSQPESASGQREQSSNLPVSEPMEVESPASTQPNAAADHGGLRAERDRLRPPVKKSRREKALQTQRTDEPHLEASLSTVADGTDGTEALHVGHHQPGQDESAPTRSVEGLPDVLMVDKHGYASSPQDQSNKDREHPVREEDTQQHIYRGDADCFEHQPTDTYTNPPDAQPQTSHDPSISKESITNAAASPTNGTGLVERSNTRKGTRAPRQPAARHQPENESSMTSDINDYMQILVYKIREQAQNYIDKVMAERDDLYKQLQQLNETKEVLKDEFDRVTQDNFQLSAACSEHKAKLAKYEGKFRKFKTFVDGIGRDIDRLKQDANASRNGREAMFSVNEAVRVERDQLQRQMEICVEKSSELKNEALKTLADTEHKLQLITQERDMLNQRLGMNVGLLSEERDRFARLARHLDAESRPSQSSQEILSELRRGNEELLDKLHIMHAMVASRAANSEISDMLKNTLEEVEKIKSQASSSAENVTSTKDLVAALIERICELREQSSNEPLQAQLKEALGKIKEISEHQEDRVRQEAAHRESTSVLEEKLKGSGVRITSLEGEVETLKTFENKLKDENDRLQNTIASSHQQSLSSRDAQAQLDEIRSDVQSKTKALESANAGLTAKMTELEALREMNDELENTIRGLREKIHELQQAVNNLTPQKQAMDERFRKEVERERAEAVKHSRDYQAQLEMEKTNEIRKLTSERDRFEKQLMPLKTELASYKKQVEVLQGEATDDTVTNEQWKELEELAESRAHEIESLKESAIELQQSADRATSLEEEKSKLHSDLVSRDNCLQQFTQEEAVLLRELERFRLQNVEARREYEQAQAESMTYRANAEAHMERSDKELKEAQEARRRAEAGQQHTQKTGEAALEEERTKSRRKVEDLQKRLANAQAEVEEAKVQGEEFRGDVDKQWQLHEAEQQQALEEVRGRVEASIVARDEALAQKQQAIDELTSSRQEVQSLTHQLASAKDELQKALASTAEDLSRLEVPGSNDGITPSGSFRSTAPTRPRKKVDRNYDSTIDATAVPAPEELRPESRRADFSRSKDVARAPVVQDSLEDAQLAGIVDQGRDNFPMFLDVDELSQVAEVFPSQQLSERVEETQLDDLPSFVAFTQSLPGNTGREHLQMSQSLSVPYDSRREPSFAIYEDQQDVDEKVENKTLACVPSQPLEPFALSQEDMNKYTFRKPLPHPNSASKLVRNGIQQSNMASGLQERAPMRERRLETPEGRSEAVHSSQSSSPAYLQPASSRPPRTYSNGVSTSVKRQPSKSQTNPSQDPRLAGRSIAQAPKRKAPTSVAEGYEQERKKRLSAGSSAQASQISRFSLRSNSQQSVHDLPSAPSMSNSSRPSNSQSHLRTYGGGSARLAGGKKASKGDEINARFSQELRR